MELAKNLTRKLRLFGREAPPNKQSMDPTSYQPATENERVTKAAGVVGSATFLSRIFGFIRDVVIAWFFGAGLSSDAFFVAFRIPNLLRRLFAEGSLSIAFIPVFTEYLANQGKEDAFELARAALRLLSVLLAAVPWPVFCFLHL